MPGRPAPLIKGDPHALHELTCNLVENAIRYTQPGGKVTVQVVVDYTVNLVVEDNGPGIPVEEREKVFERFYRVLGTGVSGSGLGLSIVSEIAAAHDAEISIDAGPGGVGTLVTVRFPAARKNIQPPPPEPLAAGAVQAPVAAAYDQAESPKATT
jgi:two-component system sensor histidine kinase TctE